MAPKKEKPDSHDRPSGETQPKLPRSKRGKKSTAPPQETPEPGAPQAEKEPGFPIAGIGASAGGLEAFEQFFTNMPAESESGMAFVLVQHLDPTHKSILTDLIKRYTRMQVYEVEDGMAVQPNCAYIIPPNKDMALLRGKLLLMEPESPRGLRLPIDYFFRSLAQDQQERAICIVLAGTGTDGTLGLKAVKGGGGMAMVQEPESAGYDGMPRSAIATGLVDYVLPPAKMPAQLLAYVEHAFGKVTLREAAPQLQTGDSLLKIFMLLRAQTGHDFSYYKQNTIHRRIERRMAVTQIERIEHYVRYLQQNPLEVETLFRELLIGVTNFFRDPEAFQTLQEQVLPRLFEAKSPTDPVRIWAPGCSSGEEAYSLAILLREYLDELKQDFTIQIFGTDIDREAIAAARAGLYPNSIAADVSPERLQRFFNQENNHYRIKKIIRDLVVFAEQNFIKDPPFSKLDLISCRNLLIYMGPELQKKVIPMFHYALNQDGFLFLGNSETVGEFGEMFAAVDRKWKIYRRKGVITPRAAMVDFSTPSLVTEPPAVSSASKIQEEAKFNLRDLVEQALLQKYTPAGAVINEKGEVLYIHGRVSKYLEPASGEASLNILRMAREGLQPELTAALRKTVAQKETVRYRELRVKANGETNLVNLIVTPLPAPPSMQNLVMIIFDEEAPAEQPESPDASDAITDKDQRIAELERTLKAKEQHLQTTIEELETSNEELKSANEELQSTNEELQSTNEELETSKEELQSVNEELVTVNTELQNNIEEFSQANNDLNNLIAGTGIATIFVDLRLRIQRFTPAATKVINLIQTDIGRPVGHLASNLVNYDELVQDIETVLDTLAAKEAEVQTREGLWYLMRILPYRTLENVIEGAVLTFVDVSEQKQAQEKLERLSAATQEAREYAENIVATVSDPLVVLDADLRVRTANPAFLEGFQVDRHDIQGQLLFDLGNKEWDIPELRKLLEEILPRQSTLTDFQMTHSFERLGKRTMRLNAREIIQQDGRERLILLSIEDITERTQAEKQVNYHKALLQILSDAVISTDLELKILSWNEAAEAIYGWREDEVLGKSMAEVIGPEFPPGRQVEVREQLLEAGYWQGEVVQSRKDGSSLDVHSSVSLVKDSDGQAIGAVVVNRKVEQRAG